MNDIPLDVVIYFDIVTSDPATGAAVDADSTPTYAVFEESTDTPILADQNFTKRTGLTGNYRGSFTLSTANGFEVGKWYSVIATAIVNTVTGKSPVKNFRVVEAGGYATLANQTAAGDALTAIKAKTDNLPESPAATSDIPSASTVASAVAEAILVTPANKLATGASGVVTVGANNDKTGYKLAQDGLDAISTTAPSGVASNFREMLVQVWRRFFKKSHKDDVAGKLYTYADDGATPLTEQTIESTDTTQTVGAASAPE